MFTLTFAFILVVVSSRRPNDPKVWLGFYDDDVPTSSSMTTLHPSGSPRDAVTAYNKYGQRSVLETLWTFFNGTSLRTDWQAKWTKLAAQAAPLLDNGTILGFFLGDEVVWNCISVNDFETMANAVHSRFPSAVTWVNEAVPVLTEKINRCGHHVDYKIGGPVNWFSVDQYHRSGPDPSFVNVTVRELYEKYIFPFIDTKTGHYAAFVPGAFGSKVNKDCDMECYSSMCQLDAEEYVQWALADDRISALIPWHWKNEPSCVGSKDEIGVATMPKLREKWQTLSKLLL